MPQKTGEGPDVEVATEPMGRRELLRAAVAGAVGIAGAASLGAGEARAADVKLLPSDRRLSELSLEQQATEKIRVAAESLLREIDPDVTIEWVKRPSSAVPGKRRVIQMNG